MRDVLIGTSALSQGQGEHNWASLNVRSKRRTSLGSRLAGVARRVTGISLLQRESDPWPRARGKAVRIALAADERGAAISRTQKPRRPHV